MTRNLSGESQKNEARLVIDRTRRKSSKRTDICLSINRLSKSKPDFVETTGSLGTSPETIWNKLPQCHHQHQSQENPKSALLRSQKKKGRRKEALLAQFIVERTKKHEQLREPKTPSQ